MLQDESGLHRCEPSGVALRFIALQPFVCCTVCGAMGPLPLPADPGDVAFV
jgi:hypothetical protein